MRLFDSLVKRSSQTLSLDDLYSYFSFNGLDYPYSITQTQGQQAEEIGSDFTGLIEGAYKQNGIVFSCLMVRQLLFQEARFQFRRLQSGRPGEYFGTRDLEPLETPAPNQTTGDLLARAIQDVDLAGNWYGVRLGNEIRRLHPEYVTIGLASKQDPSNPGLAADATPIGYAYKPPSGRAQFYHPEQIAHFAPYPDPAANFRGMSWLTPVIREIMGDQAATTHKLKYFEQGATGNMVISFDPDVDSDSVKQWIEQMEKNIGGAANAYRTLYLAHGADAKVVGNSMKDIGFEAVQGAGETRIAAAAGVPPVIAGFSEGLQAATYANYSQARRRFADGTMRPLWRNFAGCVASLIRIPRNAELWYDDRDIPFLAEDLKDAAETQSLQAQSIKALTEAGYDPSTVIDGVTAGDFRRLSHTGVFSVQLQAPGSDQAQLPSGDQAPRFRALTRGKDAEPPGEAHLRSIAASYQTAVAKIQGLLSEAVSGRREKRLGEAMEVYSELRKEAVEEAIQSAYADAYDHATGMLMEESSAGTDPAGPLAESLRRKLDEALDEAESRTPDAFRSANKENLDDLKRQATIGHVDDGGREWGLDAYADNQISTLGRRATSRGVVDAVGGGKVTVSAHGTTHPVCKELENQTFPASSAPQPPFHPGCKHMLIPTSG